MFGQPAFSVLPHLVRSLLSHVGINQDDDYHHQPGRDYSSEVTHARAYDKIRMEHPRFSYDLFQLAPRHMNCVCTWILLT